MSKRPILIARKSNLQVYNEFISLIKIVELQEAINGPLKRLLETYTEAFEDNLDKFLNISKLKMALFLTVLLFCYFFLWIPYLLKLNSWIRRTINMVNMIPAEIVDENSVLKEAFIGTDLLESIK